ncbi:MAG: universal stress protein [Deltaproteobacteria bacterium]|nr:universal stress protein [Deltaproteobacteria bacterium]
MRKIRKILWAFDGLKESNFALKYSEVLAKQFHAQILGLHVIPYLEHIVPQYPTEILDWFKKAEDSAYKKLEEVKDKLREKGIKFKGIVTKGVPYEEILDVSKREKSDLIVMGKRGYESVERDPLGSNTINVLRESQAPVLTTRYSNRKINIKKMLVPIDLSKKRTNALEYAIDIARLFKAKIYLVHVFELNNYQTYPKHFLNTLIAPSVEEIQKFANSLSSQYVAIESQVKVAPNAWKGIIDFIGEESIDLTVIATHGRKGVSKFFLGSIAERVIQEAPCAVLALKP